MTSNENPSFVIKYEEFTGRKIGFLKTETEKFFLGADGILSVVPIETNNQSFFGGVFQDGRLQHIPSDYFHRTRKVLNELTYLYKVLTEQITNTQ